MGKTRTKIGDTGKNQRTNSFSKRSSTGTLEVIRRRCKYCNHNKAFSTLNGKIKCCRCDR